MNLHFLIRLLRTSLPISALLWALPIRAATVSLVPQTIEGARGATHRIEISVANTTNLHSAVFRLRLPTGIAVVEDSVAKGTLLESNGGSAFILSSATVDGVEIAAAILGDAHDVSGTGIALSLGVRVDEESSTPRSMYLIETELRDSSGNKMVLQNSTPVIVTPPEVPIFALSTSKPAVTSSGEEIVLKIDAEGTADLHALSLEIGFDGQAWTVTGADVGLMWEAAGGQPVAFTNGSAGKLLCDVANLGLLHDINGDGHLLSVRLKAGLLARFPSSLTVRPKNWIDSDGRDWAAAIAPQSISVATSDNDSDRDGLPDDWERQYFGTLQQGWNDDFDGDGQSNGFEYTCGSNPADAADRLTLRIGSPGSTLTFGPAREGCSYVVVAADFLSGPWQAVASIRHQGPSALRTWADPAPQGQGRFYRIQIQRP
jgi:hypothetical protein